MVTKSENPPAFPMPGLSGLPNGQFMHGDHGMTLRDYLAAHCPMTLETFLKGVPTETIRMWNTADALASFAAARFQYADAMLKAREAIHG